MQTQFKVDATTFKYKKTRRGISAVCNILNLEGVVVAILKDDPECIVTNVEFLFPEEARKFLCEARENLSADSWVHAQSKPANDTSWASEYARQITMAAEAELVK